MGNPFRSSYRSGSVGRWHSRLVTGVLVAYGPSFLGSTLLSALWLEGERMRISSGRSKKKWALKILTRRNTIRLRPLHFPSMVLG